MPDPIVSSIYQFTKDFAPTKEILFNAVLQIKARVVVELGTDVGDSTRIFASALARTQGHIWTIDVHLPNWTKAYIRTVNTARGTDTTVASPLPGIMKYYNGFITVITEDSLKVDWQSGIDLLFIDSNHEEAHVLAELEKYGTLVRKGGFIFLHDTHHTQFGEGIRRSMETWAQKKGLAFKYFLSEMVEQEIDGATVKDNGLGLIYV